MGGGELLGGRATEPRLVSEAAPMTAMTEEEILTPLGMMPGSPDRCEGLDDRVAGLRPRGCR